MSVDLAAFDPGVTTGITTLTGDKYRSFQMRFDDYPSPHDMLYESCVSLQPKAIVYEAFQFRQGQTGAVFTGVEYIGILKLYAQQKKIPIFEISPSDGKGFWDNTKIKSLHLWVPGKPHAMDAARLLLSYRMKNDKKWFKEILYVLKEQLG